MSPVPHDKRIYTIDEVQDILSISKTTAYSLIKQNLFRCVKVGGHYRISKKSFDNWLDIQQDIPFLLSFLIKVFVPLPVLECR